MKNPRHGADIYEPMLEDLRSALDLYYGAGVPYVGIVGVLDLLKHDILHEMNEIDKEEDEE